MEYRYRTASDSYTVRVIELADGFEVCIGERRYVVRARRQDETTLDLWIDGHFHRVRHASQGEERWLTLGERIYHAHRLHHRRTQRGEAERSGTLSATMPGQIVSILVEEGEQVRRGQLLALMEAMKMELRVSAPHDGTVERILVAEGDAVERGQILIEMAQP